MLGFSPMENLQNPDLLHVRQPVCSGSEVSRLGRGGPGPPRLPLCSSGFLPHSRLPHQSVAYKDDSFQSVLVICGYRGRAQSGKNSALSDAGAAVSSGIRDASAFLCQLVLCTGGPCVPQPLRPCDGLVNTAPGVVLMCRQGLPSASRLGTRVRRCPSG